MCIRDRSETQARESGDFLDYENDYEEDEYYDEDGGSYEEYEDGSACLLYTSRCV